MHKDNLIYVKHILERAEKILLFTQDMDEDLFLRDEKTQSAVIREFEVIGEASKRVSEDFRNMHTGISWKLMAGMRDILIHDYEGVDLFAVWETVKRDVPILIIELQKILAK